MGRIHPLGLWFDFKGVGLQNGFMWAYRSDSKIPALAWDEGRDPLDRSRRLHDKARIAEIRHARKVTVGAEK